MLFRTLAAVPLVSLSLAGCGSGDSGSGSDVTLPAGAVAVTAIEGIAWDAPSYAATSVDGKVPLVVKNASSLPHNLHLIDSESVDVGFSLEVNGRNDVDSTTVALAPGTYKLICTISGHGNMKADLIVK